MREYQHRKNVQAKSYYDDRFWFAPNVTELDVSSDDVFSKDLEELKKEFNIDRAYIQAKQLVVHVDAKAIKEVIGFLKNSIEYDFLSDISAIDYIEQRGEFELFYQLLSMSKNRRLRVKCTINDGEAIETVTAHFRSADWAEREMYDMFGIVINNHPYLKRILMPEDWQGHPLRKTYPLHGDEFASWYEIDKIFGKEYRAVVGPEQRDGAHIDKLDTKNYARVGHEVPFGEDISSFEPNTDISYYDDKPFMVKSFDPKKIKILKKRK
jgi:NADH-quinone oxidoreductase subunit C